MCCPYGSRTGPAWESQMFFISYGIRTVPMQDLQGWRKAPLPACKRIDTTRICKNPAWASYVVVRGQYGPPVGSAQVVHRVFMISKPVRGRKLIMHALKLYGEAKFVRRRTSPIQAPWVDVQFLFKTAREQPGNNPGTTCMGPGSVMWLGHQWQ